MKKNTQYKENKSQKRQNRKLKKDFRFVFHIEKSLFHQRRNF